MGNEPRFDPRAQLGAAASATFASLVYLHITSEVYLPDSVKYPFAYWLCAVLAIGVGFLASTSGYRWITPRPVHNWFQKNGARTARARDLLLYLDTVACVIVLGWATVPTGGPVLSPYGVILLAVALIAPFVTDDIGPALYVVGFVVASYLGWWIYSGNHPVVGELGVPDWLIALTSLASVVISIFLEWVRRTWERDPIDAATVTA